MFNAPSTPIDLADDGLRVIRTGSSHGYPYICLANHGHVADVIAMRRHRQMIQAANIRYEDL